MEAKERKSKMKMQPSRAGFLWHCVGPWDPKLCQVSKDKRHPVEYITPSEKLNVYEAAEEAAPNCPVCGTKMVTVDCLCLIDVFSVPIKKK